MDSTSAGGFTAFSVLWDSLERAGAADRKKLRDAIAATSLKTGERCTCNCAREVSADGRELDRGRAGVHGEEQGVGDGGAEGVCEDDGGVAEAEVGA